MIPENNLFASQSFELELLSSKVTYLVHRLKYADADNGYFIFYAKNSLDSWRF